jgi:hypothetical protein
MDIEQTYAYIFEHKMLSDADFTRIVDFIDRYPDSSIAERCQLACRLMYNNKSNLQSIADMPTTDRVHSTLARLSPA